MAMAAIFGLGGEHGFYWLNYDEPNMQESERADDFAALTRKIFDQVGENARVEVLTGTTPVVTKPFNKFAKILRKKHLVVMINAIDELDKPAFISFEKSSYGVLAQCSRHEENIVFLSNNKPRRKELKSSGKCFELERLMNISYLKDILDKFPELWTASRMEHYNVLGSNCIGFADSFYQLALEQDSAMTFTFPCSSVKVALGETNKLVDEFRKLYPDWRGKVSFIPEYAQMQIEHELEVTTAQDVTLEEVDDRSPDNSLLRPNVLSPCTSDLDTSLTSSEVTLLDFIKNVSMVLGEKNDSTLILPFLDRCYEKQDVGQDSPISSFKWGKLIKNIILSKRYGLIWFFELTKLMDEKLEKKIGKGKHLLHQVFRIAKAEEKDIPISIVLLKNGCAARTRHIPSIDEKTMAPSIRYWCVVSKNDISQATNEL